MSRLLRPFFYFFGSKYRLAPTYPEPALGTIVEPFAGSAGYSVRHHTRNVVLADADPVIAGLWEFLIRASRREILRIPAHVYHVSEVRGPQEVRWLVGFWLNHPSAYPREVISARSIKHTSKFGTWGPAARQRVADQVGEIRHWKVRRGSYETLPALLATWFVDPPYVHEGRHYRYGSDKIDYSALGRWCLSRRGQVMVCENLGADWLPFRGHRLAMASVRKSGLARYSHEVIWTRDAEDSSMSRCDKVNRSGKVCRLPATHGHHGGDLRRLCEFDYPIHSDRLCCTRSLIVDGFEVTVAHTFSSTPQWGRRDLYSATIFDRRTYHEPKEINSPSHRYVFQRLRDALRGGGSAPVPEGPRPALGRGGPDGEVREGDAPRE